MDEMSKSFENKNTEEIINKQVEGRMATPTNVFAPTRLELNHETNVSKKDRYDGGQHKKKKEELERDAKEIKEKLTNFSDLSVHGFENFNHRQQMQVQLFADKIGALDHDYKWYGKDSTRMTAVKEALRAVVDVMNMPIKVVEGKLMEITQISAIVFKKYDAATIACDEYIKNASAKRPTGKRRLKMVDEIRSMIQEEVETLKIVIDALANGNVKVENVNQVSDLFWNHMSEPVEKAEWQKEGNSTDVYLVDIKTEEGKEKKQYYVKENLKMISDDLPGYLARRIRQVTNSKKAFDDDKKEEQEERLKEGNLSAADYEKGLKVLSLLQKKLDKASGKNKVEVRERILQFLGHDFDKFFAEYEAYNATVQLFTDDAQGRQELLDKLRSNGNEENNRALIAAINESIEKNQQMQKKTQIEYLEFRVKTAKDFAGLDAEKDKDILEALKELCKDNGENALKTFFTRTLGKEVELYGQQRERGGKTTENEILASNNIATGRLARKFGFKDEVCGSRLMIMNFKRKGEEESSDINCTVIDPAEGDEMLYIVQRAEREGLKIHYSPNAVRQLIRLQMFDTVCMQTDRHWRNFKCVYDIDEDTKKLTIKTIKSYDHDMSFGNTSLEEAFTNKDTENKKRINKNGMLPSLMAEIKTDSPEFTYLLSKKYFSAGPDFLRYVENPTEWAKTQKGRVENSINLWMESDSYYNEGIYLSAFRKKNGRINGSLDDLVKSLRTKDGKELPTEKIGTFNVTQEKLADALDYLCENTLYETMPIHLKVVDQLDENNPNGLVFKENGDVDALERLITKETLGKIMQSLKCICDILSEYTFSDSRLEHKIRFILYYFKLYFGDSKEARDAFIKAEIRDKKDKGEDAVDFTVEVPTMLHMDEEAYNQLCEMRDNPDAIDFAIKDLNWPDKKVNAFKGRIKDTVNEIDRMREKAEAYLHRVYKDTDPRYNFFLKKDAYDKIEDIKEIAWNPALSYLGIEDPNYLYGDKEFKEASGVTAEQEKKAMTETNAIRNGQRQRLGNMEGEYHSIVDSSISK